MSDGKLPVSQKRLDRGEVGVLDVTCPLCDGNGKLSRTYLYDQLGVRDMAKLATHTAKEAVTELTDKLWGQYKENLGKQVEAEAATLKGEVEKLKTDRMELLGQIKALEISINSKEDAARATQKNEDQETLLQEKEALQDQIAELRGQLGEIQAALVGEKKQKHLDLQAEAVRVREEEAVERAELLKRIDEMHAALIEEQKLKVELSNDLKRLQIEVDGKVAAARREALDEKDKELKKLAEETNTIEKELHGLKAKEALFPEQKDLAVNQAIQDLEKTLHGKELDLQNLRKERDSVQQALTEAERKLDASKGKVEERSFEEETAEIPGIWIENFSNKKKSGDYHVGLYDKDGERLLASKIIVDNKDVGRLTDAEIEKLVRDTVHHQVAIAAMVVRDESALRAKDKDARFAVVGGVTVLRTTREWFPRDLDLLRPLMRRQAEEGPDFMKRNLAVAVEVRSHMKSIDQMEKFMRLARENAEKAEKELKTYRNTIEDVCRTAGARDSSSVNEEE